MIRVANTFIASQFARFEFSSFQSTKASFFVEFFTVRLVLLCLEMDVEVL